MAQKTVTTCNVCGKIKGEKNGWLGVLAATVASCDSARDRSFVGIEPRDETQNYFQDICSFECLKDMLRGWYEALPHEAEKKVAQ